MGLAATKLAFKVFDKVCFKPVSTATETSYKIKVLLVASLDIILSNKQITKALISLRGCAGWSPPLLFPNPRRQVFSRQSPYMTGYHGILNIHTGLQIRVRIGKLFSLVSHPKHIVGSFTKPLMCTFLQNPVFSMAPIKTV